MKKRGGIANLETLMNWILWIAFALIIGASLYFLLKKSGAFGG